MAEQYGTHHLANNPDAYEIGRSNMFYFEVEGLDDILKAGITTEQASDYVTNTKERIRLSVDAVSIPNFKQNKIEIKRGNTTLKYAGTMSYQSGSLVVNDYIGVNAREVLLAWQRLSGDMVTETVGRAKNYKKNCQLIEMTCDAEIIGYWDVYGCWLSDVEISQFSMDEGDKKRTVKATIEFDYAIPREI